MDRTKQRAGLSEDRRKRVRAIGTALCIVTGMALACAFAWNPIKQLVSDPEGFRSFVAEQGVCVPNHSYRVFHWAAAARAAMALQRTYDDTAILDEFILEVENEGRLRFGPGAEGVRPAEPQDAAPDLVLPPLDAARLLFGPDSPLVPGAQAVPAGLLPLPLAFPWADGI